MSPHDLRYAERRPAATIGPAETRRRPATDQWLSSSARRAGRGRVRGVERRLARRLLRAIGSPPVGLVLWNGEEIAESNRSRHTPCADVPHTACAGYVARILFRDRAAFWKVLLDPNFQFGEAYAEGRVEVDGDLVSLLETIYRSRAAASRSGRADCSGRLGWLHRAKSNTPAGVRQNIHHHYDIGDDFYRLWLDREMVYSGAYFADPGMTLEEAQLAKLDYVCRKLWLRPGETVVEIGGGWGALALLMARNYGVTVKLFNISKRQRDFARRRAKAEGLDSRVEFIEDDYRNITGRFDALVSLGMLEHVGASHYASSAAWPTAVSGGPAAG